MKVKVATILTVLLFVNYSIAGEVAGLVDKWSHEDKAKKEMKDALHKIQKAHESGNAQEFYKECREALPKSWSDRHPNWSFALRYGGTVVVGILLGMIAKAPNSASGPQDE